MRTAPAFRLSSAHQRASCRPGASGETATKVSATSPIKAPSASPAAASPLVDLNKNSTETGNLRLAWRAAIPRARLRRSGGGTAARQVATVDFTNTVLIKRPRRDVFVFLADFENVPRWNHAITETRQMSPGPVAVGTRYRQFRTLPSTSEEEFEVTQFEPDQRLQLDGDLGPFQATLTYVLDAVDEGTSLTNIVHLRGRGLARLAAPVLAGRIRDAVKSNLDTLKALLET